MKVRSSKTDGTATVRLPLQLFNIVKLRGSKTDGPATAIQHCEATRFEDRRPCYCTLLEDRRPGCCCYRFTSDLLSPIHFVNRRRPTARLLLLLLPFHIGPAAINLLCQSTLNLLQLLPFHTGPAANKSLANHHWTCCHSSRSTLWTLSTTCCCYCCCCTPIATYW